MTLNRVALVLCLAASALTAQSNSSFESGLANWIATPPSATTLLTGASLLFPSDGAQYARVSAGSTNFTSAGHGPHTAGVGFGRVSKLQHNFTRPAGPNCFVGIDWTFVQREHENNSSKNDFLSIDIIDVLSGSLVKNMVFVDNGTSGGTPAYNGVPGANGGEIAYVRSSAPFALVIIGDNNRRREPAPSGYKRAQTDISSLTVAGQLLRIEISVANGGPNDTNDSQAYVDNFTVRSGGANTRAASMRLIGDQNDDDYQVGTHTEGDLVNLAPYEMKLTPGQNATLHFGSDPSPTPFALLTGVFNRGASQTTIGEFSLVQSAPIQVVIDGINPTSPGDVLLGTIGGGEKYLDITIPETTPDGVFAMQSVMIDPTATSGLRLTAVTRVVIQNELQIPLGDTIVEDSSGNPLGDDSSGIVDLSGMNGGDGFEFYGIDYTECFVNSNGNITFVSGDSDFSESVSELYSDQPRIAPFWDDFNANIGAQAQIRFRSNENGGVFGGPGPTTAVTISWERLSAFSQAANGNSFSVVLYEDGTIEFHYDSLNESDGIVGLSRGGLTPPLTAITGADFSFRAEYHEGEDSVSSSVFPIFERFDGNQDLLTLGLNGRNTLVFEPIYLPNPEFPIFIQFSGYRVFSGNGSH